MRVGDSEVTLWLEGAGDLLVEGWSLKKKSQLFTKVFGRKVRLRFVDDGTGEDEAAGGS